MSENCGAIQYVYRLATPAEWRAMQTTGALTRRPLDARDGFIHLSTRAQVLQTARRHFAPEAKLYALEIPLAAIAAKTRFERAPGRDEKFPHYYGALSLAQVARAPVLTQRGGEFRWEDAS